MTFSLVLILTSLSFSLSCKEKLFHSNARTGMAFYKISRKSSLDLSSAK